MSRLPAALFIVDIVKEHIAVAEARRLNIPTFAIVDTNADPNVVNYAIPANDDASTSIAYIIECMVSAIQEGLSDRKMDKEMQDDSEKDMESASEATVENEQDSETTGTSTEVKKTRKRTVTKK